MGKRRGEGKSRGGRKMTVTEIPDDAAAAAAASFRADQAASASADAADAAAAAAAEPDDGAVLPPPKKKKKKTHAREAGAAAKASSSAAVASTAASAAAVAAAAPFFNKAARYAVEAVATQEPASLEELRKPMKLSLSADEIPTVPTARQVFAYLNAEAARDSNVLARQLFAWFVHPLPVAKFANKCWERRCLLLRRTSGYYTGLFGLSDLRSILENSPLQYGTDLDITQYSVETGRKTMNSTGLAQPETVWRAFETGGFSLRFTRPHVHHRGLWQLLAHLEEHFGCGVCVNAYATPTAIDSSTPRQGFAAQFSEVEVFVLQIEGTAHWRLYAPTTVDALHPRRPSPDLHQKTLGEPFLDVTLKPGDLLYIPSGTIFQTRNESTTEPGLELRLSTGAGMTYRELIAAALPRALDIASQEEAMLRRKLPYDFLSYMGVSFAGGGAVTAPPVGLPPSLRDEYSTAAEASLAQREEARAAFQAQLGGLAEKVLAVLPLDTAADQLAKQQLTAFRLPPAFSTAQAEGMQNGPGVQEAVTINEDSWVRLATRGAVRMCLEENSSNAAEGDQTTCTIYHALDNAAQGEVQYAGKPLYAERGVLFSIEFAPALDHLISTYPQYVPVAELPEIEAIEEAVELAGTLFELGVVHVRRDDLDE